MCPWSRLTGRSPSASSSPTDADRAARPFKELPSVKLPITAPPADWIAALNAIPASRGGMVRLDALAPFNVVFVRHPELHAEIYRHETLGARKSPHILGRVRWIMGRGTFIHAGENRHWADRRAMAGPRLLRPYSMAEFISPIDDIVRAGVAALDAHAGPDAAPIDLAVVARRLVTDLTFRGMFSHDLGSRLHEIAEGSAFLESVFQKTTPFWLPTSENRRYLRTARLFKNTADELIAARRRQAPGRVDALTDLFEKPDPKLGRLWNDREIRDELFSLYFGASAMATPVVWTILALTRHPAVYARLQAEIAGFSLDAPATAGGLDALPYLSMVQDEVSRLFPAFWCSVRHADQPTVVGGHLLPANTTLVLMRYHAQRHPDFWPDPEGFDPDRFTADKVRNHHPYALFPYGGGPRLCLGHSIAPRIIHLLIVRLLQRFHFTFAPHHADEPRVAFHFGTYPEGPVRMRLTRLPRSRETLTADAATSLPEAVTPSLTPV